jgi:hypothetical protein
MNELEEDDIDVGDERCDEICDGDLVDSDEDASEQEVIQENRSDLGHGVGVIPKVMETSSESTPELSMSHPDHALLREARALANARKSE